MELKKQSIRSNILVKAHNVIVDKDEIITMSKLWSEKQIIFFKKMLKQGGDFKINGVPFEISVQERTDMRSDGNIEGPIVKIPGDGRF